MPILEPWPAFSGIVLLANVYHVVTVVLTVWCVCVWGECGPAAKDRIREVAPHRLSFFRFGETFTPPLRGRLSGGWHPRPGRRGAQWLIVWLWQGLSSGGGVGPPGRTGGNQRKLAPEGLARLVDNQCPHDTCPEKATEASHDIRLSTADGEAGIGGHTLGDNRPTHLTHASSRSSRPSA